MPRRLTPATSGACRAAADRSRRRGTTKVAENCQDGASPAAAFEGWEVPKTQVSMYFFAM
jgi:hypothetical protein